mgnify:CR=1 FL=1
MLEYINRIFLYKSITKKVIFSFFITLAIVWIDMQNIPSRVFSNLGIVLSIFLVVSIISIVVLQLWEWRAYEAFKIKSIIFLDLFLMNSLLILLTYLLIIFLLHELLFYKGIFLSITICMLTGGIVYRKNLLSKDNSRDTNVINLSTLVSKDFVRDNNSLIFVEEKDANYDLLDRNKTIDFLYNTLTTLKPKNNFVISLEGRWGSGKSTILNNVKERIKRSDVENLIVIDEFDPSVYNDEVNLFENMFMHLIEKSDIKFKMSSMKQFVRGIVKTIFESKSYRGLNLLVDNENIVAIKSNLDTFLRSSGKRYVFIIDNIDRVETKSILSLFRMINQILDFSNVTYVLSFDDTRVKTAFENDLNVDYSYLKKMINLPVKVPEMNKEKLKMLYLNSLENIFKSYGKNINREKLSVLSSFLIKTSIDIRDFIRFINSSVNFVLSQNQYLYDFDLLILELIKIKDVELYNTIHKHSEFFTTFDKSDKVELDIVFRMNEYNERGRKFFTELFNNRLEYLDLLSELFPNVEKFQMEIDLRSEFETSSSQFKENRKEASRKRKVCSDKFFDLYFTFSENVYLKAAIECESFIEKINKNINFEEKKVCFQSMIENKDYTYQMDFLYSLQIRNGEIKKDNKNDLIKVILSSLQSLNDNEYYGEMFRERVAIIVSELLPSISLQDFDKILENERNNYKLLSFWGSVCSRYGTDFVDNGENRKRKVERLVINITNDILNNNIDLYDERYYFYRNIFGILKFDNNKEKIEKYIRKTINKDNVYKFIYDLLDVGVNPIGEFEKPIYYRLEKEEVDYFASDEFLWGILKRSSPKNNSQRFILEIFQKHINSDQPLMEKMMSDNFFSKDL